MGITRLLSPGLGNARGSSGEKRYFHGHVEIHSLPSPLSPLSLSKSLLLASKVNRVLGDTLRTLTGRRGEDPRCFLHFGCTSTSINYSVLVVDLKLRSTPYYPVLARLVRLVDVHPASACRL